MMEALAPSTSLNSVAPSVPTDGDVPMLDAPALPASTSQHLPQAQQPAAGDNTSRLDVLAAASAIHLPLDSTPNPADAMANPEEEGDATSDSGSASASDSMQSDESMDPAMEAAEAYAWREIAQDTSVPTPEEMRAMEQQQHRSALDHDHWRSETFTDLQDPEHSTLDSVEFDWPITKFNGTAKSPNKSLVMYSPSFALGGAQWRLKMYPKGNETGYISVYLECQSLQKSSRDPSLQFKDGGDAEFCPDQLQPILPTLHIASASRPQAQPLRRHRSLPVQFGILMYNAQAPTVHYYRASTHLFTYSSPDAGFARFGSTPVRDLGQRCANKRAPLLQGDSLHFRAYARVIDDPTSLLFHDTHKNHISRNQFSRTGLRDFRDESDSSLLRGPSSLFCTVLLISLLPPARKMLYAAEAHFSKTDTKHLPRQVCRPLLTALVDFLEDIRDGSCRNSTVDCDIPRALNRHALTMDDDPDVVMMLDRFGLCLDKETKGAGLSFRHLLLPASQRHKLPLEKTTSVRSGVKALMEAGSGPVNDFPRLLQVELPRWYFDHHERKWKHNAKRITLNEPMRLTSTSAGVYRLYACVLHHEGFKSGQYSCIIRPDLKSWYRFDSRRSCPMPTVRLTSKQAMDQANRCAYFALYVRDDVAKSDMSESSKTFQGWPESHWQSTKRWIGCSEPIRHPLLDRFERVKQILQMHKAQQSTEKQKTEPIWASTQIRVKYFNPFEQRFETPHDELIPVNIDLTATSDENFRLEDLALRAINHGSGAGGVQITPASFFGPLEDGDETRAELQACNNVDPSWALFLRTMTFLVQPVLSSADRNRILQNGGLPEAVKFAKHVMQLESSEMDIDADGKSTRLQDHLGQEYHRGDTSRGMWHGKGYRIYFNGDVYDGVFQMGLRHGQGFQTFQNGDTYDGEWLDDKMHGQGTFTQAATGNTYRGVFQRGQQSAPGTTTWRVAESRRRNCHICYEEEQNAAFMDCGHICACLECARKVDTCPVCRRPVIRVLRIFHTT